MILTRGCLVGRRLSRAGHWGQLDLAGNVAAWTFDATAGHVVPCVDCAERPMPGKGMVRGGGFRNDMGAVRVTPGRGSLSCSLRRGLA